MTQLQRTTTIPQFNPTIWNTLELVRLRQIPWHKKQAVFEQLQPLGLIQAIPQTTQTPSHFPAPLIAILTEEGRQLLEARSNQQEVLIKQLGV
ncbi:MAG TPA: hypothetical protein PLG97_08615 [Alcaligenes sp.]|nr:hypothetical protein [Alcaligenes sp.]HRL27568.1 hypothetical protein [Alcaligenes sp.]